MNYRPIIVELLSIVHHIMRVQKGERAKIHLNWQCASVFVCSRKPTIKAYQLKYWPIRCQVELYFKSLRNLRYVFLYLNRFDQLLCEISTEFGEIQIRIIFNPETKQYNAR